MMQKRNIEEQFQNDSNPLDNQKRDKFVKWVRSKRVSTASKPIIFEAVQNRDIQTEKRYRNNRNWYRNSIKKA